LCRLSCLRRLSPLYCLSFKASAKSRNQTRKGKYISSRSIPEPSNTRLSLHLLLPVVPLCLQLLRRRGVAAVDLGVVVEVLRVVGKSMRAGVVWLLWLVGVVGLSILVLRMGLSDSVHFRRLVLSLLRVLKLLRAGEVPDLFELLLLSHHGLLRKVVVACIVLIHVAPISFHLLQLLTCRHAQPSSAALSFKPLLTSFAHLLFDVIIDFTLKVGVVLSLVPNWKLVDPAARVLHLFR